MTALTATQRGELAERLLPAAAHLICLVHGDGGPRDIQQALARLTPDELAALPVVLAALADPDRQLDEALGWVTWDEHGQPAPADRVLGTVRDLAAEAEVMPAPQLRRAALVEDTAELARQGLHREAITARLGASWETILSSHKRCGVPTPELVA